MTNTITKGLVALAAAAYLAIAQGCAIKPVEEDEKTVCEVEDLGKELYKSTCEGKSHRGTTYHPPIKVVEIGCGFNKDYWNYGVEDLLIKRVYSVDTGELNEELVMTIEDDGTLRRFVCDRDNSAYDSNSFPCVRGNKEGFFEGSHACLMHADSLGILEREFDTGVMNNDQHNN